MTNTCNRLAAVVSMLTLSASAFAQTAPTPTDHGAHHGAAPVQSEHASPTSEATATVSEPTSVVPAPAMPTEPAMDHGELQAQGGSPPPDARDPHAYSDGFVRGSGKYSLEPGLRLRMGDEHRYAALLMNRFERSYGEDDNATVYDAQAWFGTTYDRLVVKAEGERSRGTLEHARTELLWGHALAAYWDAQVGIRYDSGEGPDREWLAIGIQGLAPYWFELDATAYLGLQRAKRAALRGRCTNADHATADPAAALEANAYGKSDRERGNRQRAFGCRCRVRLRYEIRAVRSYVGFEWCAGTATRKTS